MPALPVPVGVTHGWRLADLPRPAADAPKVMTTFCGAGGSSMGYKLAGCNVIIANDIDPDMGGIYQRNLHPETFLSGPVCDLVTGDLPEQAYNLDILDGSPPCSAFSTQGLREKTWGKETHFREGQAVQVLDDLFFDFVALANRLQPKVVVAENVAGLVKGNAKGYAREVVMQLTQAGYDVQLFRIDAQHVGVPQTRDRVFFVGRHRRMGWPPLQLSTAEFTRTTFWDACSDLNIPAEDYRKISGAMLLWMWQERRPGENTMNKASVRLRGKKGHFGRTIIEYNKPLPCITAGSSIVHSDRPVHIHTREISRCGTFPDDYDFGNVKPMYAVGMSVPPFLSRFVASHVVTQWLSPATATG